MPFCNLYALGSTRAIARNLGNVSELLCTDRARRKRLLCKMIEIGIGFARRLCNLLDRRPQVDTQTKTLLLRFLLFDIARLYPADYAFLGLDHVPVITAAGLHHRYQGFSLLKLGKFF